MEEQSNEEAPHFTLLPNIETPKGNIQIGKPQIDTMLRKQSSQTRSDPALLSKKPTLPRLTSSGGGETTVAGGPDQHDFNKVLNEEKEFLSRIQAQLKSFDHEARYLPNIKKPQYQLIIHGNNNGGTSEEEEKQVKRKMKKKHHVPQPENKLTPIKNRGKREIEFGIPAESLVEH